MDSLKAGETRWYQCNDCMREYEITLEPKAKDSYEKPPDRAAPVACPFCGETDVEEV